MRPGRARADPRAGRVVQHADRGVRAGRRRPRRARALGVGGACGWFGLDRRSSLRGGWVRTRVAGGRAAARGGGGGVALVTVYLVGAGPGDPGLMSVRALELIAAADVIVYDRLIPPGALDRARAEAELIYAGKEGGGPSMPQSEISRLLVSHGASRDVVVRLKGGDPFVFGRGGEEAEALRAAGVPFEVVPGVTAGVAAPAYAGIPVTHRGAASAVAFVTGHEDPEKVSASGSSVDWGALAAFPGTIAEVAASEAVRAPSLIVVGEVVSLRERLAWFSAGRPLAGVSVAVTRARAQASGLAARLRSLGAEVVEAPAIRIVPLDGPIPDVSAYDLVCLTSPNGVRLLFDRLRSRGLDARALAGSRVAAIGPGTARALSEHGVIADIVPERFVAEGLVEALAGLPVSRALVA